MYIFLSCLDNIKVICAQHCVKISGDTWVGAEGT